MKPVLPSRTRAKVSLQSLEDRRMLAAFGTPWADARNLTISFPADNVAVGSDQNDLHQTLDQIADRQEWQELALRAYQTWSIHADINVGLRNDFNTDFGTPGLMVGDPRYGEFRIGAFPQLGLLASSVPFQAIAGTNSGDLLLNSNESWTYHDWANDLPPDPNSFGAADRDLYTVLLHEVGNTLGLADTTEPTTVLFGYYNGPVGVLSASDIAAIQDLYGARTDPFELVDNGQIQFASLIPTPPGIDVATEVIRTRGSLLDSNDVDYYKITPVTGQDTLTIKTRARGLSLLNSRLQVFDSAGQLLSEATSTSVFDNDNQLVLSGISSHNELYLKVSPLDPTGHYAFGDYVIELDYRSAAQQATDLQPGAYDAGPDALFAGHDLVDQEVGGNDDIVNAIVIPDSSGGVVDRYEIQSSVSSHQDVDYLKVTTPQDVSGRLAISLSNVESDGPDLKVSVVDSDGVKVGAAGQLRADGTYVLEVSQPQAGADYYIRIAVDSTSTAAVGNYVASAEFESTDHQMHHLVTGALSDTADDYIRWTAQETKLYRFDLTATGASAGQAVRMTIYDAHTREVKATAVSQAGVQRYAMTWLLQGDYIIRFTAISFNGSQIQNIAYSVRADGLSDDVDDDPYDPENDHPDETPYHYDYPYDDEYVPEDDEAYYDSPPAYYYDPYYYY